VLLGALALGLELGRHPLDLLALRQDGRLGRDGTGEQLRAVAGAGGPSASAQQADRRAEHETDREADDHGEECVHESSVTGASDTARRPSAAPNISRTIRSS